MLIEFENDLVETFKVEQGEQLNQSIQDREVAEKESLRKNVSFNAQILSGISAKNLYDVDPEAIKQPLQTFMNFHEILAIQVFDEDGKPFAAIWRTPAITVAPGLPDSLKLDQNLSVHIDSLYNQAKIGSVVVYYTETSLTEKIKLARETASKEADTLYNILQKRLGRAMLSQSIGILIVIVALVACLLFLVRTLVIKPMSLVSQVAHRLTSLDLTVSTDTHRGDEVGKLFTAMNEMVRSFRNVVGQVQRSGIQVTSSSTELAATAKEQETIMTNQVEFANKVVHSVKEISDVTTMLVQTMQQVASMSQETTAFANKGQSDLLRMEEAMRHMEEASTSISSKLAAINEKADNITTVVTTITKVADQTNLLSLNAAIEAEKAGEYGRGFTVVAREIRRLADQTAVATLDIERMVQEMQSAVSSGIMEMDKFIKEVQRSTEDVGKISMQLTLIIDQVQALSPRFEEVSMAMGHQSENAQNINNAMLRLSEEMQQTKESLHETYSAIGQLNEAAKSLQDEVSRFKVT